MRLTSQQTTTAEQVMTVSNRPGSAPDAGRTRRSLWARLTGRGGSGGRGTWDFGPGDAETVLAEARKALFVMVGFLALIWIIQIANWADQYRLAQEYGIRPRDVASLPDVLSAPFLHFSWSHIEGNSGPLFIFGFLAAYRGVTKFLGVTVIVILTSGLAAWLSESPGSVGAGASGVVFGYFGYIMVRGFFDRHLIDILIGAVMALCFAYQFTVLLPQAGIGWQAHIGGLVGGVASGWIFRDRRTGAVSSARLQPRGSPPSPASGPRAELHKQIDDLGL
jgi:membrane associated rhomboid family serine protease